MLRESLKHLPVDNKEFRHRGAEPGRIENFSDAVLALAITLLLISTSPPSNFTQIKKFLFDLIPFIISITFIALLWYQHFIFFYRYGLRNARVVTLNTVLLIIVLFYVYPLKFLAKLSLFPVALMFDVDWLLADLRSMINGEDMGDLMIIYGIGAACTSFTLLLMYRYALSKKDDLQLSEVEIFDTRTSIMINLLIGAIPLLSVILALIFYGHWYAGMIAGFTYFLYTPVMAIHGRVVDRRRKTLLENQAFTDQQQPEQITT